MPTSDVVAGERPTEPAQSAGYQAALEAFLAKHCLRDGRPDIVATFHAVRNLPYFSSGDRTPEAVLRDRRGACTAKHLLLRDLLRRQGETADVEIVEGDFARGVPEHPTMSDALRQIVRSGGIADFHCYVVWRGPEREVLLDATWPDRLADYGFDVNSDWVGIGDTRLAIAPAFVKARVEDVIERKERLLAALPEATAADRKLFLRLLSEWLAGLN